MLGLDIFSGWVKWYKVPRLLYIAEITSIHKPCSATNTAMINIKSTIFIMLICQAITISSNTLGSFTLNEVKMEIILRTTVHLVHRESKFVHDDATLLPSSYIKCFNSCFANYIGLHLCWYLRLAWWHVL